MIKDYIVNTILVSLLLGMIFFGNKAYNSAINYEETTTILVQSQTLDAKKERIKQSLAGLIGVKSQPAIKIDREKFRKNQELFKANAISNTVKFMSLFVILLIVAIYHSMRTFTFFGSLGAMVTLILGLIAPILMVTIHKEVEYIGDIVLSFESKGVIGSIVKLFDSGDIVVAIVIALFSVVVPVLKVLSLLFISLFMKSQFATKVVKFFKMIGKWSMVDVFVVAVFLVYLTANKGDISKAEIEVGLYFFLAYVIVSMLVSISATKLPYLHQNGLEKT